MALILSSLLDIGQEQNNMYNKLITIVLALLAIACNNDKPISYATVPVIPIDPPTSVEGDSWTPSHEYLIEPIIKSIEIQSNIIGFSNK